MDSLDSEIEVTQQQQQPLEEEAVAFYEDPEARRDPHPFYRRLRTEEPVLKCPVGLWYVSSYEQVVTMLKDDRLSREARNSARREYEALGTDGGLTRRLFNSMMLWRDAPEHPKLRSLVRRSFSSSAAEKSRPQIASLVQRLVEPVRSRGTMEFVKEIAYPFPIVVTCDLLGIPEQDAEKFELWADAFASVIESDSGSNIDAEADAAFDQCREYLRPHLEERKRRPRSDVLTVLAEAHQAGTLSEEELIAFCLFLIIAGFETTAKTTSNGLWLLLRHPSQMDLLRADLSLLPKATDEILRYDSAARNALPRWAKEDLVLGGRQICRGDKIVGMLNAANRDPGRFRDPEDFDILREDAGQLAFGMGAHFCLGSHLARVEMQEVLRVMVTEFPDLHLSRSPVWSTSWAGREIDALHLAWS